VIDNSQLRTADPGADDESEQFMQGLIRRVADARLAYGTV
jgi:hypothetical protein